jgi:hypothetical protein
MTLAACARDTAFVLLSGGARGGVYEKTREGLINCVQAYGKTGTERQVADSHGERETRRSDEVRPRPPLCWDEIGRPESVLSASRFHSAVSEGQSKVAHDYSRRFVWLSPRALHPHPALERYGIALTTVEHNRIAQQDDAAFQEAVEITTTGTILDGYAQWKTALHAHCSQILCIEYSLTDEQAIEWLLQRHRRRNGWNKYCRIVVVLELENKLKEEVATQRNAASLSNLTKGEERHVRSKLAKLAGVCEAYIDYVKELRKEAHSSLLQALERGEISIHWAWTLLEFPKCEQSEILENRRTAKAVRVAYPRSGQPKNMSLDPSRLLQVCEVLATRDARDIKCTVVPIDDNKIEIRVQINEELFTSMQSQGDLKLS